MKNRLIPLFLLAFIFLLSSIVLFAQEDDQGNPNDPNDNDRANACYDGGTMESKCDTEWEWVCGWYMIRFEEGVISRNEVPASCSSLLPVEVDATEEPGDTTPVSTCVGPIYGFAYVNFKGSNFIASPADVYADASCTEYYSLLFLNLVYTTGGSGAANSICDANLPGYAAVSLGSNIYYCTLV